jgi:DNA-binding NtrC family response regulator
VTHARVLVVDDETSVREMLSIALGRQGYRVETADSADAAMRMVRETGFDVVLTDIRMPDGPDGVELLQRLKENDPELQVILMTAYASLDTAVSALRSGAFDYITKPFQIEDVQARIDRAFTQRRLVSENRYLRREVRRSSGPTGLLGESPAIATIREMIDRVAPTASTVLITGESGTGKELVAHAIHDGSPRSGGPFVTVNCGALPEGLLESELFGHKKGSFTGAVRDKEGLFLVADGGTLFLDEIGETTPAIQVRLLRALQEREIVPVGSTQPIGVDVRVLAATNASLEERVATGAFREDLYYRLNVVPIHVPPLRERRDDIPLLVDHFLERYGGRDRSFSPEAMERLGTYDWPGNVRELENVVERTLIMDDAERIGAGALPEGLIEPGRERLGALREGGTPPDLETVEKAYIAWVLHQTGGVKTAAAEVLGIDPSTLHRKMDRYGLRSERSEGEGSGSA